MIIASQHQKQKQKQKQQKSAEPNYSEQQREEQVSHSVTQSLSHSVTQSVQCLYWDLILAQKSKEQQHLQKGPPSQEKVSLFFCGLVCGLVLWLVLFFCRSIGGRSADNAGSRLFKRFSRDWWWIHGVVAEWTRVTTVTRAIEWCSSDMQGDHSEVPPEKRQKMIVSGYLCVLKLETQSILRQLLSFGFACDWNYRHHVANFCNP